MKLAGPHIQTGDSVRSIVLLIHGYGSNGKNLYQALAKPWSDALSNTLFLCPNGPFAHPYVPDGFVWFELNVDNPLRPQEVESGLLIIRPILIQYIETLQKNYHVSADRIVPVGFSQGGIIALDLLAEGIVSRAISYSGAFHPMEECPAKEDRKALLVHGTNDDVIPHTYMTLASHLLRKRNILVESFTCQGLGHSINDDGVMIGKQFLWEGLRE